MMFNTISGSSAAGVRPVGRRLDVTVQGPAAPEEVQAPEPQAPAAEVGSIRGVLSAEENQAIAALFGRHPQGYTAGGAMRAQRVLPGAYLDIRA